MNKVLLMILAGCVSLVACTVNYITGDKNSVNLKEHRGVILDADDDSDITTEADTSKQSDD